MAEAAPSALFRTRLTLVLRVIAVLAGLIAAISMGISHETVDLPALGYSIKMQAKDVSSFMWLVACNVLLSLYSFMVLFLPKTSLLWRTTVLSDLFVAFGVVCVDSCALGMFYLEWKGNSHAHWAPVCGVAPSYCRAVTVAFVAALIAVVATVFNIFVCQCTSQNPLLLQGPPPPPPKG